MDAIDSLRDLLGRYPRLWTMRIRTEYDAARQAWHVRLRLYHWEGKHAANVSPECANVLGLHYDRKDNAIAYVTRAPEPSTWHVVRKLSARLYQGDERKIEPHQMD